MTRSTYVAMLAKMRGVGVDKEWGGSRKDAIGRRAGWSAFFYGISLVILIDFGFRGGQAVSL